MAEEELGRMTWPWKLVVYKLLGSLLRCAYVNLTQKCKDFENWTPRETTVQGPYWQLGRIDTNSIAKALKIDVTLKQSPEKSGQNLQSNALPLSYTLSKCARWNSKVLSLWRIRKILNLHEKSWNEWNYRASWRKWKEKIEILQLKNTKVKKFLKLTRWTQ